MKKAIIFGIVIIITISLNNIWLNSPKNNFETTETDILFEWSGKGEFELHLDNNNEFTSPIIKETTNKILIENLSVDKYYWFVKTKYKRSITRTFEIISLASINRNNSLMENTGNVDLNVSRATGFVILPVDKSIRLEDKNIIVRQK